MGRAFETIGTVMTRSFVVLSVIMGTMALQYMTILLIDLLNI
jgi:hypothetical protein